MSVTWPRLTDNEGARTMFPSTELEPAAENSENLFFKAEYNLSVQCNQNVDSKIRL